MLLILCFLLSTALSAPHDNTDRNQQQVEKSDSKFVSDLIFRCYLNDQSDKDIPKPPVMISQLTLLSSPRPPEHHL